jgi:hypothetical protein
LSPRTVSAAQNISACRWHAVSHVACRLSVASKAKISRSRRQALWPRRLFNRAFLSRPIRLLPQAQVPPDLLQRGESDLDLLRRSVIAHAGADGGVLNILHEILSSLTAINDNR